MKRGADAAEPKSADRQVGASGRGENEEEAGATPGYLWPRSASGIDQGMGGVRLSVWTAFGAGVEAGNRAAARGEGTGLPAGSGGRN